MKKYLILAISLISLSCSKEEVSHCAEQDICNLLVYPNPFTSELTIDLLSDVRDSITIQFYSIRGQKVAYQKNKLSTGKNSFLLTLDSLRSGLYFFQANSSQDALSGSVLKK